MRSFFVFATRQIKGVEGVTKIQIVIVRFAQQTFCQRHAVVHHGEYQDVDAPGLRNPVQDADNHLKPLHSICISYS